MRDRIADAMLVRDAKTGWVVQRSTACSSCALDGLGNGIFSLRGGVGGQGV